MKFRLSSINMNSWMMQLNSSKAKTKDNKVSTSRAMQKEEDKAKAFKELYYLSIQLLGSTQSLFIFSGPTIASLFFPVLSLLQLS